MKTYILEKGNYVVSVEVFNKLEEDIKNKRIKGTCFDNLLFIDKSESWYGEDLFIRSGI